MKKTLFICAAAMLLIATSCKFISVNESFIDRNAGKLLVPSANIVSKKLDLLYFYNINADSQVEIEYTPGETAVEIFAPDNLIDSVLVHVTEFNDALNISTKAVRIANGKSGIKVRVSNDGLSKVTLAGACEFNAPEGVVSKHDSFTLDSSGAAEVRIRGVKSKTQTYRTRGAVEMEISDIKASTVNLLTEGAADIEFKSIDCSCLDMTMSGASDCNIDGKADSVTANIRGAGTLDVQHLEYNQSHFVKAGAATIKKNDR